MNGVQENLKFGFVQNVKLPIGIGTKRKLKMGVYKILNVKDGKCYVGGTLNLIKRFNSHKCTLKKNLNHNEHLQKAFIKDGIDNFLFIILEFVSDKKDLIKREQFWIDEKESSNREKGYNVCPKAGTVCGESNPMYGKKHSEESKKKMSEDNKLNQKSLGKNNPMYGKNHSEETKRKISETKKNSEVHLGKNNSMYGKKHSEKSKRKMSEVKRRNAKIKNENANKC